ncbi:MAG: thiamine phosphate synthase [Planctomycetota bacterium]
MDPLRERLRQARLYLVVTPRLCRRGVEGTVAEALAGGVDMVQLRDKESDDAAFLSTAARLSDLCRERGVLFLVNDRVALLNDARADGVHVGEQDTPPEEVRRRYGPAPILGLSTHDRAELAAAEARGADYAGLGPIYATETKKLTRVPQGPRLVSDAYGAARLPVFPIGGIDARNAAVLVAAGASRLAVSSAICAADDPRSAAASLKALLTRF